ncbi:hypothetical protein H9X86_09115 [Pseudoflavonifractor capillosus]|uniref:hypothetical protein n=1 Tax=Pseudoflavonifractor capillosus TaxID=106588 RepID=UPI00195BB895|nr:hypothetical protein [Pseudoflavonifractor capillosus]MBM6897517.1 hypothetical protein [Pseudoflavonifractor capillosus]
MRRTSLCMLSMLLCGVLCACTAAPVSPDTTSNRSSSQTLTGTYTPAPAATDNIPNQSWDIPAYQPDVETPLSYQLDGATYTANGLRHYSLQGYSMVYDPAIFTRQGWEDGDSFMVGPGNYLSVSRINGMDAATVRQGLILQENIPDLGQQVTVGSQNYTAHTLVVSPQDGIYRQFWILELSDHSTLLVEQSYVMDSEDAALYHGLQLAMLDTLTIE